MKTVAVNNKWLSDSDLRFDASFHLSDGVKTKRIIDKYCPYQTTVLEKEADELFKGGIHKRVYVNSPEHGLMFFSASDMFKSDVATSKYLSKKYSPYLKELALHRDWILITRSGTLGKVVYTTSDYEGKIGTDDLVRIKPKEDKIKRGYLYSFLSSKYGYSLLTQSGYGGVIKHIEPHHIQHLRIPIFPNKLQEQIDSLIEEATEQRVIANKCLHEATFYFESKFQIKDSIETIFSKKITDIGYSWVGRNNDIEIEKVLKKIKERTHFQIAKKQEYCYAPPLFKHIYIPTNNGHPFYTGAELSRNFRRPYRYLSTKGVRNIDDYKLKDGQILIYKSGPRDGLLGNVFLYNDTLKEACLSDHVIRLKFEDKNLANWVFAFLKSKIGLRILHNNATGAAILFITPERVGNIPIPEPDENYKIIVDRIEKFKKSYEVAFEKEKTALELVEKEIESWQN